MTPCGERIAPSLAPEQPLERRVTAWCRCVVLRCRRHREGNRVSAAAVL